MIINVALELVLPRTIVNLSFQDQRTIDWVAGERGEVKRIVGLIDRPGTANRRRPELRAKETSGIAAAAVPYRSSIEKVTRPGVHEPAGHHVERHHDATQEADDNDPRAGFGHERPQ